MIINELHHVAYGPDAPCTGVSVCRDYVPVPPVPGSPIPPMPEPFEESEPQLDLPRPLLFGSNGGEDIGEDQFAPATVHTNHANIVFSPKTMI